MTAPNPRDLSGSPAAEAPALERSIARLLVVGTYGAIAFLATGLVLMLAGGVEPLSGGPAFDPGRMVADIGALQPAGFLWLGLVVVVATPAARVAASLVGYLRGGEQAMAVVAGLILIVIAASVALAKGMEG